MEIRKPSMDPRQALQLAQNHRQAGRLEDAERVCRDLLDTEPDNAEIWHLLGVIAHQGGNHAMAAELIEEAVRLGPPKPDYLNNLGGAYQALGRAAEAEENFRGALKLRPDHVLAQNNLGIALRSLGRLEEAEQAFRRATALKPDYAEAHNNLGNALREQGRLEEAERSFVRARTLKPGYAEAHGNLGITLRALGRLEEAERSFRQALALNPGYAEAHNDLGATLFGLGRLEEAGRSYREAIALDPNFPLPERNLLVLMNYAPEHDAADICAAHRAFAQRHFPSVDRRSHGNAPAPDRPLRVGYVSGDFRVHSVAYFIEPVLACHDRSQVEVFCYHNAPRSDAVTDRLRAAAAHWREVAALDDDALVELIRADAIDVLVDLSGHTLHNRLPVFARKPAPVQATWLGYPATTGLAAVDYRLTDAVADPMGESDRQHAERLARLPGAMWCYLPDRGLPEPRTSPPAEGRPPTFGSFNNFAKLNDQVIALWTSLLGRLPGTRLLMTQVPGKLAEAAVQRRFEQAGIEAGRLELHGTVARAQLVELFLRTDIALDPFPYAGTTTTCEVLWLGIPVVTLAGATSAARSGASLLGSVGLPELVARTPEQYVEIAAALAGDPARLAALRAGMRERMRASPLMDAPRFTRDLENAYRAMWRTWCAGQTLSGRIAGGLRKLFGR